MNLITVNLTYLDEMAASTRLIAAELDGCAVSGRYRVGATDLVQDAFLRLSGRWDQRRDELAEALEAVASSLETCRASFASTDAELAAQLEGGS